MRYQAGFKLRIDWNRAVDHVLSEAQWRHQGQIKILHKDATWYWHAFHVVVSLLHYAITFGRAGWHYDKYNMTLGRYMFRAPGEDGVQQSTRSYFNSLRHEIAHFDHMYFGDPTMGERKATKWEIHDTGSRWNMIKHGLLYLWGTPWPFKYADFRAEVEYWGYLQNVRIAVLENGGICPKWIMERIEHQFTGPGYAWMSTKKKGRELVVKMVSTAEEEWLAGSLHMKIFGAGTQLKDFVI